MVGELETRRKNNLRSKFIETAIRNRLDNEQKFDVNDLSTVRLLAILYERFPGDEVFQLMINKRQKESAE